MRRIGATIAGLGVGAIGLTGCAFGDYLAYAPCEGYSEELAQVIEETVGERPTVGDIWADGANNPLCWLTFTLERDLTSGDPEREEMGNAIDDLRAGWQDDVRLEVISGSGESFIFG
ncbi:hypothetical protein [Microbacterium sp. SA39]|uniref:hypothetical protein n=1 Tax=Microbacterium sp. SA39 TaxID=1263625 RepID=UPI0005F9AD8F|nr:hypothetical protein [Microbacterium sp. SA39]KJQ55550.1 hypothetical protein RS85_00613 [Microbacterium sp. SA39]